MGTIYSEVVVTCLTCLDPENADFGNEDEFQDEDGILVGVRYIEKVSPDWIEDWFFNEFLSHFTGYHAAQWHFHLIFFVLHVNWFSSWLNLHRISPIAHLQICKFNFMMLRLEEHIHQTFESSFEPLRLKLRSGLPIVKQSRPCEKIMATRPIPHWPLAELGA